MDNVGLGLTLFLGSYMAFFMGIFLLGGYYTFVALIILTLCGVGIGFRRYSWGRSLTYICIFIIPIVGLFPVLAIGGSSV